MTGNIRLTRPALLAGFSSLTLFALAYALPAHAGLPAIVPACARVSTAQAAGLDCALETFQNVANLILGVTGSFALLMFVYGGFTMLTSGGNESKVTKGKEILRNAVIGIFIIMTAGYMIDYGVQKLTGRRGTGVGSTCSGGGRVMLVGGEEKCVATCPDLSYGPVVTKDSSGAVTSTVPGMTYSCQNINNRTNRDAGCERGLCPRTGSEILCCPRE